MQSKLENIYNITASMLEDNSTPTDLFNVIINQLDDVHIEQYSKNKIKTNLINMYKLGTAKRLPSFKLKYQIIDYLGKSLSKFENIQNNKS